MAFTRITCGYLAHSITAFVCIGGFPLAKIFGRELTNSKLLSFSGIASFIVGLILIFICAGSLLTDFRERATETDQITLSGMSFDITADILEDDQGFFFDVEDELLHI